MNINSKVVLGIILVLVVGGVIFYTSQDFQSTSVKVDSEKNISQQTSQPATTSTTSPSQTTTSVSTVAPSDKTTSQPTDVCTAPPTPTDIGSDMYPISPKYKQSDENLNYLGQIFTASKCGPARMEKINGVEKNNYIFGVNLVLKAAPSSRLLQTLKDLNFTCADKVEETRCTTWRNEKNIPVNDLLKLEPFFSEFQSNDCINCG